jgi:hypothetical protein
MHDVFVLLHPHDVAQQVRPQDHPRTVQLRLQLHIVSNIFRQISVRLSEVSFALLAHLIVVKSVVVSNFGSLSRLFGEHYGKGFFFGGWFLCDFGG